MAGTIFPRIWEICRLMLAEFQKNTASQMQDGTIQNEMDLQILFTIRIAVWIKWEINAHIVIQCDPATILVSHSAPLTALGLKNILVQHCGISQFHGLSAHASLLHSTGRDHTKRNLF